MDVDPIWWDDGVPMVWRDQCLGKLLELRTGCVVAPAGDVVDVRIKAGRLLDFFLQVWVSLDVDALEDLFLCHIRVLQELVPHTGHEGWHEALLPLVLALPLELWGQFPAWQRIPLVQDLPDGLVFASEAVRLDGILAW